MEAICVMTTAYNNIVQGCATDLHGRCAKNPQNSGMENISSKLKALRERTGLSVRDVARYLEFETHSRYAYYESPRYTGDALPLPLARRLAGLFKAHDVRPEEVLVLAGLQDDEAAEQAKEVEFIRAKPIRVFMEVQLPNEASLTRMFDAMLELAGHDDASGELARTLAVLLPDVLAGTTSELSGESLDPDFRPWREARAQRRTKGRPLPKP